MELSVVVFLGVVGVEAAERVFELVWSRRNRRRVVARGGVVHAHPSHAAVVVLHTMWLVAAPLEVLILGRPFSWLIAAPCAVALAAAMAVRAWTMAALGDRWNIGIITESGVARIDRGPYRCTRHPNYLAVVVEHLALPLLHSAWFSGVVLGTLASAAVVVKMRAEEHALSRAESSAEGCSPGGGGNRP